MAVLALGLLRAMRESAETAGLGRPESNVLPKGLASGWLLCVFAMVIGTLNIRLYFVLAREFHAQQVLDRLMSLDQRTDVAKVLSRLHSPVEFWSIVIVGTFLAPIAEELLFRGFIYRFAERYAGTVWAIAVSSLVFAAAHGGPIRFVPILLLGLVLGIVRRNTGSVWQGIIMHMTLNGIMFLLLFAEPNSLK